MFICFCWVHWAHCLVLACFQLAPLHCLPDWSVYMLPNGKLPSMGLPNGKLVCVAHVHYHRRSHHPSSLTSQCPSSSLSIPEPEPQQCTSGTVLRTVFSAKEVFLALLFSLWSALMDPAMQSDQRSEAQTPAKATSTRSSAAVDFGLGFFRLDCGRH